MSYYLAPSLSKLRDAVNARWPKRDKSSDGWIGDTSHSARKSDHNPDYADGGVVRALDVDKDGIDVDELLEVVVGADWVAYIIWNRRIWQHATGWKRYWGINGHTKHIHISIRHTKAAENATPKALGGTVKPSGDVKPPATQKPATKPSKAPSKAVQTKLKAMKLSPNAAGVKAFQKQHGLVQDSQWGKLTEAKYKANKKLQEALNKMKSTTAKLVVDGYIGTSSEKRIDNVLYRNKWTRKSLEANLKKVGALK